MQQRVVKTRLYTASDLAQRLSLPLEAKVVLAKERIKQWHERWDGRVYVAFSGGKDSTVLLDLVRSLYQDVVAVFIDTGLEYPEIREFVGRHSNVVTVRPEVTYKKVIEQYGYPIATKTIAKAISIMNNPTDNNKTIRNLFMTGITGVGKKAPAFMIPKRWLKLIGAPFKVSDMCCAVMKKRPTLKVEKEHGYAFVGIKASDSEARKDNYQTYGCNAYNAKRPMSCPLGVWTDQDIFNYIVTRRLELCSVYGKLIKLDYEYITTGVRRTGCMFCMFGIQYDRTPNRFQVMAVTHPKHYRHCMEDLGIKEVLEYIGYPHE